MFHQKHVPLVKYNVAAAATGVLLNTKVCRLTEFFARRENGSAAQVSWSTNKAPIDHSDGRSRRSARQDRGCSNFNCRPAAAFAAAMSGQSGFLNDLKRCEEAKGMRLVGRPRGAAASHNSLFRGSAQAVCMLRSQRLITLTSNFSINIISSSIHARWRFYYVAIHTKLSVPDGMSVHIMMKFGIAVFFRDIKSD